MAGFLKHVGKHGDRKVCVLFREVPGDDHMCLVVYPEVLPSVWQDAIQRVLESEVGQQAEQLADALHRSFLPDGRAILETLHAERMIKKIRSADVLITPRVDAKIRLDELNKMLNEMKQGDAAIKRMAENDASRGMVNPDVKRAAEARYKEEQTAKAAAAQNRVITPSENLVAPQDGILSDHQIAANMLAQAKRMEKEANEMVAEAARMKKDAERLVPTVDISNSTYVAPLPEPPKRGRGRPAKSETAVSNAAN